MRTRLLPLLAALAVLVAACGGSAGSTDEAAAADGATAAPAAGDDTTDEAEDAGGGDTAPEAASADFTVGLALAGPRNDRGFYQSHFEGVETAAEDHGFEYSVVDSLEDPQGRIDALRNLAEDNEIVLGGGAAFADAGNAIAEQFPDTTFIVTSGVTDPDIPNLHSYVAQQGAPAFLAGFAAVEVTETNKIGFIGGAEIPPTFLSDQFFQAAVEDLSPDAEYVSTVIGSFNDAALAKEAASAQIASDADVIFAFLDAGIPGVLQAVDESGEDVKIINPITDRCEESEHMLGFTFLNAQLLVQIIMDDFLNGELPEGTQFYALQNTDIQDFRLCPRFDELTERIDEVRAELQSGERELPSPEG